MAHWTGAIKFSDDEVWYFQMNGVTDTAIPQLYKSFEECEINWRQGKWIECTCNRAEPVAITVAPLKGWWEGTACRFCKALVTGLSNESPGTIDTYHNELPSWSPFQ